MSPRKTNALFSAHDVLAALKSGVWILSWAMAALVAAYLFSGIAVIKPNEAGLILRFGKVVCRSHPPGLLYALPPPMDEVIKVPVKSVQEVPLELWATSGSDAFQTSISPVSQPYTLTGDVNIIRASFVVRYQISDPIDYTLSAMDNGALRDGILYEAACRVLSSMSVEDALTIGKNYIGLEALRIAQEKLDRLKLGIHLLAFETREISPPASVSAAFESVVSAKVRAKTLVEEANAYAASSLPVAQAEAYRIQQEAESYAQQRVAAAQGESISFSALQEDRANPGILRARLRGEMLAAVLPKAKLSAYLPGQGANAKVLLVPKTEKAFKAKEESSPAD